MKNEKQKQQLHTIKIILNWHNNNNDTKIVHLQTYVHTYIHLGRISLNGSNDMFSNKIFGKKSF